MFKAWKVEIAEVVKRLEISEGVDLGLGLLGLLVSIDLRLVGLLG